MWVLCLLDLLPNNFRHEKSFFVQNNLTDIEKLSNLSDLEINEIQRTYSLCTLNNLKKIRAIAIFKKKDFSCLKLVGKKSKNFLISIFKRLIHLDIFLNFSYYHRLTYIIRNFFKLPYLNSYVRTRPATFH